MIQDIEHERGVIITQFVYPSLIFALVFINRPICILSYGYSLIVIL